MNFFKRTRRSASLTGFLLLAFTVGTGSGLSAGERNLKATDFSLKNLKGDVVQLSQLYGKGPIVINFWATWCQPCITELPHLEAVSKEYEDIEVLLVSLDHRAIGAPRVKAFLEKRGHSMQSFMLDAEDPAAAMLELYPDFPGAIPITLIFDGDGDLSKAYHRGVSDEDLRKAIYAAR